MAAPDQIADWLETTGRQLKGHTGKGVPLAITEYNGMFTQETPVPYQHSIGNALLNADLLRVFLAGDTPILCSNYWQFANSYWGLVYGQHYVEGNGKPNMRLIILFLRCMPNTLAIG